MEAKLKTLKVVDLKDILAKAAQPPPQKATKSDLIARILASKDAVAVYNQKFAPKDDLLAPPEDLDWDVDQANPPDQPNPSAASAAAAKTASKPAPVAVPAPASPTAPASAPTPAPAPSETEDAELEKRRKRAERFGVPLVEAKPPPVPKKKPAAAPAVKVADNPEKLQARAARFGGQKRPAPVEEVDAEELERRKKRAERFGTGPAVKG
ncbi:hypothetical protein B0H15DRAFT_951526 [Mycena belliarum]|uniref:THO1-MOS11 C-terminal domain-containing protein n=1 Tax=Mycena belliarum TaxID=1033014 RepID=A0AAD6XM68_9AGAR|nr:hypothetical protein B0H15DRAFT_951526 [Mycena belliae]